MDYLIRRMAEEDYEQFVPLFHRYIEEYITIESLVPVQYNQEIGEKYWNQLRDPQENYIVLVAVSEKIVAFCVGKVHEFDEVDQLYFVGKKEGEALELFTTPETRNHGIAVALLKSLEQEFKTEGCEHMILSEVDLHNDRAKKIYTSLGFTPWTMKFYKKI